MPYGLDFQVTLMHANCLRGKTPETSTHIIISFQFPLERWAQNTPLEIEISLGATNSPLIWAIIKIKIQWFTSTIKPA
jgi:hypothetical protein